VAEATQSTAAAAVPNPMLTLANRVHDLAALLSSVGFLLNDVHSNLRTGSEEERLLRQAFRAVTHCETLAGDIASDVEEGGYV